MPYVDPDEANTDVVVRFPGDPFPQPTTHNTFERRESPTDEFFAERGLYEQPMSETEWLMSAPGTPDAMSVEASDEYGDVVEEAYESALSALTSSQRQAWELQREGYTERAIATVLGITPGPTHQRIRRSRERLSEQLAWVIDPALRRKYHQPKPKPVRPMAQIRTSQHVGTFLARSDYDDAARFQVGRGLQKATEVGTSPTELVRRTQILPVRLAELITEYRRG